MIDDIMARVPEQIRERISGRPYTTDSIGLSGGEVYLFEDMVLKVCKASADGAEMAAALRWLEGKLPVPKVIEYCTRDGMEYLLMSRLDGRMSCDTYYLERSELLLGLMAEGLRMLWSLDISDCPRSRGLDAELAEARRHVEQGLVDISLCEPDTFGEGGFKDPADLLEWLENNKPACDPVFSHGDFGLPNVLLENDRISGFIDLGDCGVADRWRDISLCWKSLRNNFNGNFGGKVYPDFDPDGLFRHLGIQPDRDKLRYYLLLDELF